MVEAAKHTTQTKIITVPIGPNKFVKAEAVKVTPAALSESQTPDTKMRRAVAEQMQLNHQAVHQLQPKRIRNSGKGFPNQDRMQTRDGALLTPSISRIVRHCSKC